VISKSCWLENLCLMLGITSPLSSDTDKSFPKMLWYRSLPSDYLQMHSNPYKNHNSYIYAYISYMYIYPCHLQRLTYSMFLVVWWHGFPVHASSIFYNYYFYEVIQLGNNCLPKLGFSGEPLNTALVLQITQFFVCC
jgi:hypothetical protein